MKKRATTVPFELTGNQRLLLAKRNNADLRAFTGTVAYAVKHPSELGSLLDSGTVSKLRAIH